MTPERVKEILEKLVYEKDAIVEFPANTIVELCEAYLEAIDLLENAADRIESQVIHQYYVMGKEYLAHAAIQEDRDLIRLEEFLKKHEDTK